jgi:hypothetical protein
MAGLVVGRFAARRWSLPLYAVGAAVALSMTPDLLSPGGLARAGGVLLFYGVLVYAVSAVECVALGIPVAVAILAGGVVGVLTANAAAPGVYPPALAALAWLVYAAGIAWERRQVQIPGWVSTHRLTALAAAGLTALGCVAVPEFSRTGNTGAFAAAAALWACSLMLFVDGRRHHRPLLDYAAVVVASLGSFWVASYAGATNPQWYVALPGAALTWSGLALAHDRRQPATPDIARIVTACGLGVLIGTSAVQSIPDTQAAGYTTLVVLEGVAALLGGIALRNRTLVLGGAAAVAVGALRALLLALQQFPLFAVFGVVALVLLGGAALLAVMRERVARVRTAIGDWAP